MDNMRIFTSKPNFLQTYISYTQLCTYQPILLLLLLLLLLLGEEERGGNDISRQTDSATKKM
jgi:hypothetical protein